MSDDFLSWSASLKREQLDLWREAMSQLRQLHNDVWNGVRFFLTINGILLAAIATLTKALSDGAPFLLAFFTALGLIVTFIAHRILAKHRQYYLEMLLRKTLIEEELGFWKTKIGSATDVVFPWRVPERGLNVMRSDPGSWLCDQPRRAGTISRLLFLVYEGVMVLYVLILFPVLVSIFMTWRP